ncbi:MAG: DUF721 domain-containing protein [Holosporales bacterium]|jgi:hypothetical protein|nr:DUF721 domain-containing protein [Holosporales bacterium]
MGTHDFIKVVDTKRKKQYGSTSICNVISCVVAPVYKKNGFLHAELILDWTKIVGDVFSKQCRPIRISGIHPHCCLYIGAPRSVAVQMVYIVPQLIERIHVYFGFSVIENIRFIDDHFSAQTTAIKKPVEEIYVQDEMFVEYVPLSMALSKLNYCIKSETYFGDD